MFINNITDIYNRLHGTMRKLKEKCKKIERDHKTQILSIEKQIITINQKIDQQEKRADCIAKQDNEEYIQLWDLQLNYIICDINNVKCIPLNLIYGIGY